MNIRFQRIADQLERQRKDILDKVKHLPEEKFNHSPAPGKWSVSQILTHIVTSERLSVGYLKKKARGIGQLKDSGISASFRLGLLIISQRVPFKYKAPRVVVENTPGSLSFKELDRQWDAVRSELMTFLEGVEEKNVRKLVFKHPIAGRFDARQTLIFFREHINHHWPQIEKLLK